MEDQSRFKDAHTTAYLFAAFRKDYAVTDPLFKLLDHGFKDVLHKYDNVRALFSAWGHAGGDAGTLWNFIKDNSFGWEKLLTFAFRAACVSFARVNAGDGWAIEQLITHQWAEGELEKIANSPDAGIVHRAVDGAEMWLQANDVFPAWRRGEVADVILRDWSQHNH